MHIRHGVAAFAAGLMLAGCSSNGSTVPGPPAAERTVRSPALPPTSASRALPRVTEAFTLLPCPAHPAATIELEGCAEHRIVRLDARIDRLARQAYDARTLPATRARFVAAHEAWIGYRRAECRSEADAYAGGSLEPLVFANCEVRLDRQRLRELRQAAAGGG